MASPRSSRHASQLWSDDGADASKGKTSKDPASSKLAGAAGPYATLDSISKVDMVADFRTVKLQRESGASPQREGAAVEGKGAMPDGVQLLGGEAVFEEQEDGSQALVMPEGGFLKVTVNASPWVLEEDGRLHNFTIVMAIRLDVIPTTSLPLFNGGAPPPSGEKVENVQVFKNGGVGALNDMGTQEAAVHAERFSWVVVTRKPGELCTYVDGRLCAAIKLEAAKKEKEKERGIGQKEEEEGDPERTKDKLEGTDKAKQQMQEKFVIDPQFLALFAATEEGASKDLRSLTIKYLRITSKVWTPQQIADELHMVRTADEEAEVAKEAETSRAEQLSLQPLYARPPPIWLHPAFAAEFADPFIAATPFEDGAMHVSIEVLTLALDEMLKPAGIGQALPHATRSALNTACTQLKDCRKLAHKLAHARKGGGQERAFFSAVSKVFSELEPGGVLLLPWDGESSILIVIRRGVLPAEHLCTLTVINPTVSGSKYHQADGDQPPKVKYQTCLELGDVPLEHLEDEAWWVVLWFGMCISEDDCAQGKVKRGPLSVLYEVLLPYLTGDSLDRSIVRWQSTAATRGGRVLPSRTLRRSNSGHYGCCRHALSYLLLSSGLQKAEYRHASLLLRLQMLLLAQHDLKFIMQISDAERTILKLAGRQLAYKAAKLGADPHMSDQMSSVRREIESLEYTMAHAAGPPDERAPPPLVLCEADAHLGRPSLELLLGDHVLPPFGEPCAPHALLEGIEVVGLYFGASWCGPCKETTPLLASAYKSLRAHGKGLELVFVSQDESDAEYDEYRATMPWPALPFGGHLRVALTQRYQVTSLPTLLLLDARGALISTDGVRLLRRHTRSFPWTAQAPQETPHLHPLCDRLLRLSPVDPGQSYDLPKYKPLDFLLVPQSASTLPEAVAALRELDLLCTQTAVQSHSVLNTYLLKVALIQHTFTAVLPMPKPEGPSVGAVFPEACLWRTPMLYDQQLGILLMLKRITEHFAASALSLDHTRSLDAVRIVVSGCIAAVADVVMRQIATDKPSRVCVHLRGTHERKGFTIGCAALAKQSAELAVHTAELNTARTCVLDYFGAQAELPQIYGWETTSTLEVQTVKWLRLIAQDLAFPADISNVAQYIRDADHLMSKNFPVRHRSTLPARSLAARDPLLQRHGTALPRTTLMPPDCRRRSSTATETSPSTSSSSSTHSAPLFPSRCHTPSGRRS